MTIHLVGTSHVSAQSVEDVSRHIDAISPDVVAVELDPGRLRALETGTNRIDLRQPMIALIQYIQQFIGRRTGVSPGSEQLEAVHQAEARMLPVALVDQDIRTTIARLKEMPWLERIKIAGFTLTGLVMPFTSELEIDLEDPDLIQELLVRLRVSFPHTYEVLLEERNAVMAERLDALEREYGEVLAFVGAGHVPGIRERLTEKGINTAHP